MTESEESGQENIVETILVVDDAEANRIEISAFLGGSNSTNNHRKILTAGSGKAALECIKTEAVSLVLLDLDMPDLNGFATASAIRAMPGHEYLPIIFMSAARISEMDIELGYSLGAFDYISKPIKAEILKCRVEVFLRQQKHQQELERVNASLHEQITERLEELEECRSELSSVSKAHSSRNSEISKEYASFLNNGYSLSDTTEEIKRLARSISKTGGRGEDALSYYFNALEKNIDDVNIADQAHARSHARELLVRVLTELVNIYSEASTLMFKCPITELQPSTAITVESGTSLRKAIFVLKENNIGCLLVKQDSRLKGIMTERDFLMKVIGEDINLDCAVVDDYMTTNPEYLHAVDPLAFAINRMQLGGFRHIPLLDVNDDALEIISVKDIITFLAEKYPEEILNLPPTPENYPHHREGG
ncbi:MAG: response regulator [Myxococcota bacterium]|nr:response regulator [Myxococcota bacterium]